MDDFNLLIQILSEKTDKLDNISVSTTLEGLGVASTDLVDMMLHIEEAFNVVFEDEELLQVNNIQDILNLIQKNMH